MGLEEKEAPAVAVSVVGKIGVAMIRAQSWRKTA